MRYLGSFLPDSCGRYLLFVIGGQCLESEPVEETVAVLLVAYSINTDVRTHRYTYSYRQYRHRQSFYLLFMYLFISVAH